MTGRRLSHGDAPPYVVKGAREFNMAEWAARRAAAGKSTNTLTPVRTRGRGTRVGGTHLE